uniref:Protein kinase domain-containing protein n=1 Tax=Romanomermis culicivorax TaxID=13658 RepID=A0A915IAX8_ROMCU
MPSESKRKMSKNVVSRQKSRKVSGSRKWKKVSKKVISGVSSISRTAATTTTVSKTTLTSSSVSKTAPSSKKTVAANKSPSTPNKIVAKEGVAGSRKQAAAAAVVVKAPFGPKPGDLLNKRFKVGSLLGCGGFGAVYNCLDEKNGQKYAIK